MHGVLAMDEEGRSEVNLRFSKELPWAFGPAEKMKISVVPAGAGMT